MMKIHHTIALISIFLLSACNSLSISPQEIWTDTSEGTTLSANYPSDWFARSEMDGIYLANQEDSVTEIGLSALIDDPSTDPNDKLPSGLLVANLLYVDTSFLPTFETNQDDPTILAYDFLILAKEEFQRSETLSMTDPEFVIIGDVAGVETIVEDSIRRADFLFLAVPRGEDVVLLVAVTPFGQLSRHRDTFYKILASTTIDT